MQVNETMAASNGFLPSSYDDGEDKHMLLMKQNGDGHGITALINRQLQGKDNKYSQFLNNKLCISFNLLCCYLCSFFFHYF